MSNIRLSTDGILKLDDNLIATEEESNSTLNMNSIDDGNRFNSTGSLRPDVAVTERKRLRLTKRQINIVTWNVRTLKQVGQLHFLIRELGRMNCKRTGISETRWNGNGYFQSRKDFNTFYSESDHGKVGVISYGSRFNSKQSFAATQSCQRSYHIYPLTQQTIPDD